MDHLSFAAEFKSLLPWMLFAVFYIEAARRTWQNIFLAMPSRSSEPLYQAIKSDTVPMWFMILWYILWVPIMLISYINARHHDMGVPLFSVDEEVRRRAD